VSEARPNFTLKLVRPGFGPAAELPTFIGRITPLLVLATVMAHAAAPPEQRFLPSDLTTVYQAKFQVESAGAAALPKLMPLLDRPDIVKLTDTADLCRFSRRKSPASRLRCLFG
jgi:hypothetical protein